MTASSSSAISRNMRSRVEVWARFRRTPLLGRVEQGRQLGQPGRRVHAKLIHEGVAARVVREARPRLEHGKIRLAGTVALDRLSAGDVRVADGLYALQEGVHQGRLADAGGAADEDRAPCAAPRSIQRLLELVELRFAPDHLRRQRQHADRGRRRLAGPRRHLDREAILAIGNRHGWRRSRGRRCATRQRRERRVAVEHVAGPRETVPAAPGDDRVAGVEQRLAETRSGRQRAIAGGGEEHALVVVHHPERAHVVARAGQQERAPDPERVTFVAVAALPGRSRSRLAGVGEDEGRRRTELREIRGGEHALGELPAAAHGILGVVAAVAREVDDVVLLQRGQEPDAAHALPAEECDVDAGQGVEQAAQLLRFLAGLRQRLGGIRHQQHAQAIPGLPHRAAIRDALARDDLPPEAELRRQEIVAVVAELPGDVDQALVEPQVEVGRRRFTQARTRRLGQEM